MPGNLTPLRSLPEKRFDEDPSLAGKILFLFIWRFPVSGCFRTGGLFCPRRERKIQAALDAGAKGMDELLAAAYDDVSREMWKYAEYTLKAHLVRLGVTDLENDERLRK